MRLEWIFLICLFNAKHAKQFKDGKKKNLKKKLLVSKK